jgi:hypothetical protein
MEKLFVFAMFVLLFSGCAQRAPKGRGVAATETGVASGGGLGNSTSEQQSYVRSLRWPSYASPYTRVGRGNHLRAGREIDVGFAPSPVPYN